MSQTTNKPRFTATLLIASSLLIASAIRAEGGENVSFYAERDGTTVHFAWSTATEVGNLGFNVYALESDKLQRLNDKLIPSQVVDSLEPQRYSYQAYGVQGELFLIEDVDIFGDRRYHGAFTLGESYGPEELETERIE